MALADAGAGFVLAAHRQLDRIDAARPPRDAAAADGGVEYREMLVGHGRLRISWLHVVSLMPGGNMGLEIVAIHPNPEGTWWKSTTSTCPIFVIPGRAKREPGIHSHDRKYGFRACA
jgi:hypothetical protein